MKLMFAYSPAGRLIVGTREVIPAMAQVDKWSRGTNGELQIEYSGGTTIWWEDQRTVEIDGQRIFVDEDGNEWPESTIVLKEDETDEI